MGSHPDVCSDMELAADASATPGADKGKYSTHAHNSSMPGNHPDRHELAPGAVIAVMACMQQQKSAQKGQTVKVAAVIDTVLGPAEAAAGQLQLFNLPVCLRDVHYAPNTAGKWTVLSSLCSGKQLVHMSF